MNDTIKMPGGGYDVKVVRKEDILKCIDSNIVDKDVMLAFINQFEVDASNFLSQGRWTSLPYIGTLRKNQYKEALNSEEIKELDEAAKENLEITLKKLRVRKLLELFVIVCLNLHL